jgi:hypothetical protein
VGRGGVPESVGGETLGGLLSSATSERSNGVVLERDRPLVLLARLHRDVGPLATYRRASQLTVPRSVDRSSVFTDLAAAFAGRCDAYVASWRGRCLPVAVSMPSTGTTYFSRCLRTVG